MFVPKVASYVQRKLDRRDFFKLAAVVGVAVSLGGRELGQLSSGAPATPTTYGANSRHAQYGRQRGRYPVARG